MKNIRLGIIAVSTLLLASCGTNKMAVKDTEAALPTTTKNSKTDNVETTTKAIKTSSFAFVEKVNDRKVTADNIVADLTFSATMGDKDVSVPGSLHMRKDQMIRIQLFVPLIHTEVGRLEFTPDYVLVVDRLHKQYVKEDYNKLDFLRANGLDFYALQALFWNQLFLPGKKTVGEGDVSKFKADLSGAAQTVPVSLMSGSLSYLVECRPHIGTDQRCKSVLFVCTARQVNAHDEIFEVQSCGHKGVPVLRGVDFPDHGHEESAEGDDDPRHG
jgi:hypothetical protein